MKYLKPVFQIFIEILFTNA